ncbi:hypothetical protein VE04_06948 [Pseudogymnoascus sp. 24MN13]|nr:hypothetical protein VE04_06948 [Pseudogymnoascus sp. 24MN13]
MTTASFKYIDPASYDPHATEPFKKPWTKVDGAGNSYRLKDYSRPVHDLTGHEKEFTTDNCGFAVYTSPAKETSFTDDKQVKEGYYGEVEALVRQKLPGVKKVVIFDHTIRRREKASPRQPVQLVHIDRAPAAAEVECVAMPQKTKSRDSSRVAPRIGLPPRRHRRGSIDPSDFVKVDLLYPKGASQTVDVLADPDARAASTEGYEVTGEQYVIAPNEKHRFHYFKDMTPDMAMFIKCFDSESELMTGSGGIAHGSGHTAFIDPQTPKEAPGRQSIEVRCLVFYE